MSEPTTAAVEEVARIIDPEAWEDLDDLTPTERELWETRSIDRQEDARRKATAILALPSVGWRTIDSAPKDGTVFIIGRDHSINGDCPYSGLSHWNGNGFCDHDDEVAYWHKPTHWQPLPSPPHPVEDRP